MPNQTKELLQIEFRYCDEPNSYGGIHKEKKVIIGIFDTLEEAIDKGNETLAFMSQNFEVRPDDRFILNHLFGSPKRLVTNTCYPTNGIQYFAQIVKLDFGSLGDAIVETFLAYGRYKKAQMEEQQ